MAESNIFVCPNCGHKIKMKDVARFFASKGGKTKGPTKARTSEQARLAALARWQKVKEASGDRLKRS